MPTVEIKFPNGRLIQKRYPEEFSKDEIQADIELMKARNQPPSDPTAEMSTVDQFLAGTGRGMVNVGRQIGNMVGLVDDQTLEDAKTLDQPLLQTTPGQVGNFAGEMAALAPTAGGLVAGLGRGLIKQVPRLAGTASRRPIATGAATGLTEGALEGAVLSGPGQREEGAITGGLLGGLGGGVLSTISKGFRQPSESARKLEAMGIDLTPGQMKPEGGLNQLEEAMSSAPIVGPIITRARQRPQVQFAQSMVEQSLPPGGAVQRGDLGDMLSEAQQQFSQAYGNVSDYYVRADAGPALIKGFDRAAKDRTRTITDSEREGVTGFLENQLSGLRGKDVRTGDLIAMRSNIRGEISRLKRNQRGGEAYLLEKAEDAITKQLNRNLPKEAVKRIRDIDTQYGKYKIAEDAIYRAGDRDFPTPFQWQQAVKRAESSKGAYARGGGRFRDEAKAAKDAFTSVSPATGQRIATLGTLGALAGAGLGAVGFNDPFAAVYGGVPLALLAGSRTGRRAATGMTDLQQAMSYGLDKFPVGSTARGILPILSAEDE